MVEMRLVVEPDFAGLTLKIKSSPTFTEFLVMPSASSDDTEASSPDQVDVVPLSSLTFHTITT